MFHKKLFLCAATAITFASATVTEAQDAAAPSVKYRRSSLHTMIMESEKFPKKDTVIKAFYSAPFPDKYNDHNIGEKSFDASKYTLTSDDIASLSNPTSELSQLVFSSDETKHDTSGKSIHMQIAKYMMQNKIANKMVAKWFDRAEDGSFDMNLIGSRGSYNASDMEANIAKGSKRGVSSLADAGLELIGNSFIVVSRFNFVSNEAVAAVIRDASKEAAGKISMAALQEAAKKAADKIYEKTKEGYSVWATSYLYKMVWNDSTEAVFYNDLWFDKKSVDAKKKAAFDNSNLFRLEFIGDEKATGLILFSLKEKRTEDQIITKATIRTIDAVYAKLQKKYDVFKTKTPLFTGYPITAKIGTKEGLEGGEKFEVFEQTMDEKTGLTKYVSKGTIKVDKDLIWDNSFNFGDEQQTALSDAPAADAKPPIDRTTFDGGKKYYSGMLIRQIK
jgi:hypothetical protein